MILFVLLCLMARATAQPNNLGPTLLIILGIVTAPVGVGILILLPALALLKEADGRSAFPCLSHRVARVNCFLRIKRFA